MIELLNVGFLPYDSFDIDGEGSIPRVQITKTVLPIKQDSKITSKKIPNKFQGIEKTEIITQIEESVGENLDYRLWEIGITMNPLYRKSQLAGRGNNVHFWKQWRSKSHQEALEIKRYFVERGMNANAGDRKNAIHIYIF